MQQSENTIKQSEKSDVVALRGYLGERTPDDNRNLYETLEFQKHLVISVKDIVDEEPLTSGESVIAVRRKASLLLCEPVSASYYDTLPGTGAGLAQWPKP